MSRHLRLGAIALLNLLACTAAAQNLARPTYSRVQDEGTLLPQQLTLNCVGAGISCTNDAGGLRTNINVSASSVTINTTAPLGGGGTGGTFTLTCATCTTTTNSQVLTNKSIDGNTNTLTNVPGTLETWQQTYTNGANAQVLLTAPKGGLLLKDPGTGGLLLGVAKSNLSVYYLSLYAGSASFASESIGTNQYNGISSTNATAAANNAQQYSPLFSLLGHGWTGAASHLAEMGLQVRPIQGNPVTADLVYWKSINGGAYGEIASLNTAGEFLDRHTLTRGVTWAAGSSPGQYTLGAAAGDTATMTSIVGGDEAGRLVISSSGAGKGTGTLVTVYFKEPFAIAPIVGLSLEGATTIDNLGPNASDATVTATTDHLTITVVGSISDDSYLVSWWAKGYKP